MATSIGGTRQPDGSVTIGIRTLAEHYPDIAAARMPGPGSKNTEFAYKGVAIFMAGRAGDTVTIDRIVRGPKERSFTNNLTHPDDGRSITIDRWQCKAMAGDMPITYGHAKQTHTDNKDLVDDACAKKAAAELTRD